MTRKSMGPARRVRQNQMRGGEPGGDAFPNDKLAHLPQVHRFEAFEEEPITLRLFVDHGAIKRGRAKLETLENFAIGLDLAQRIVAKRRLIPDRLGEERIWTQILEHEFQIAARSEMQVDFFDHVAGAVLDR